MVGCFFRDLGVNILRNMVVRCIESLLNTNVFLKLQIFEFSDILGVLRDGLGPHFGGFFGYLGP